MKDFHLCGWLLSYDLSKISAKLVISLKHNIIFAKFLEILLDNSVTPSHTHIQWQSKNYLEAIWVYISRFFIKGTISLFFGTREYVEQDPIWHETLKIYQTRLEHWCTFLWSINMKDRRNKSINRGYVLIDGACTLNIDVVFRSGQQRCSMKKKWFLETS